MNKAVTYDIFDYLGGFLIILPYTLVILNKIKFENKMYHLTTFIGGVFATIHGVYCQSWYFVILNSCWMLVSICGLFKIEQEVEENYALIYDNL